MSYKKFLGRALLVTAFTASSAMAAVIQVDTGKGPYASPNSSIATEVGIVNTAFGVNLTNYAWAKEESESWDSLINSTNTDANGATAYTIDWQAILASPTEQGTSGTGSFSGSPSYFVLKFGFGNGAATLDTYVFKNDVNLPFLTFSSTAIGGASLERLSHITLIDDEGSGGSGGNPVPEPASLALLGAGLAGLMLRRRQR